ncbi:hypothetical protein GCM10023189_03410 [Nibrella saemangeumensis]|uniref:DUF1361 domain-containing protein n=1 Tax=Nibrella saemangeumensis TaxID=1084526 RepID=A0ABP8MA95_9BACT
MHTHHATSFQRSSGEGLTALALLTVTGLCMVTARGFFTGNWWLFTMLTWNLALAWFPLGIMLVLRDLVKARVANRWLSGLALAGWLVFLPNAPYIITDLFHIRSVGESLLWFDTLTLFLFALTGLLAGLYSTLLVHRYLNDGTQPALAWLVVLAAQGLSGFGIYLGRYGRWNSWDILTHPDSLLVAIGRAMRDPMVLKLTLTYGVTLACLYLAFYLYGLRSHVAARPMRYLFDNSALND